eukprot:54426-Chlamydomonas_euryale.AAC.6
MERCPSAVGAALRWSEHGSFGREKLRRRSMHVRKAAQVCRGCPSLWGGCPGQVCFWRLNQKCMVADAQPGASLQDREGLRAMSLDNTDTDGTGRRLPIGGAHFWANVSCQACSM